MTANNKKKQNTSPDKRAFNYWIWLILIGPAFFFLYYWLTSTNPGESQKQKPFLPEKRLQAGEPATIDKNTLLAAPEGRVIYTEQITLGNNRIVAEGGQVFSIVPLVISEGFGDPSPVQWYLTDMEGNRNDLLRVVPQNPAGGEQTVIETGQGKRLVHLIFKVKKEKAERFLVYLSQGGHAAWKMPSPADF